MSKVIEKTMGEICSIAKRNGSLTMEDINKMSGEFPVYAASVGVAIGYINSYLNDKPAIIVPTAGNGTAGKPYVVTDPFYTIGANAVGFVPEENIDVHYVFFQLKNILSSLVKGESFKNINQGMIKKIKIVIPIKEDKSFDLEEQQRLSGIYFEIERQRQYLSNKVYEIQELLVHIDKEEGIKYEDVPLNSLVIHENGNASYTKTWCQKHKGEYPIYSANNIEPIDFVDSFDYDGEYLTYSKNGCAGYITIIGNRFSVNGDRCVMRINEEYVGKINILYLKYYLEPIFRKNKKGRLGAFEKNEFTKLNSSMIKSLNILVPIPLATDGSYDLDKQREIAERYKQIDEIKKGLIDKIVQLTSINVVPDICS